MLDKSKLIDQLYKVADQLFVDTSSTNTIVHDAWQAIIDDPLFMYKVAAVANPPWPVPLWKESLSVTYQIDCINVPHVVISVDGSQIYPDRHAFLSCFLINTGSVVLPYNIVGRRVELFSEPTVFAGLDEDGTVFTTDTVNCKRQELELLAGLNLAHSVTQLLDNSTRPVVLFDGSLIFWHLSSKETDVRDRFLSSYLGLLNRMASETILTAWYISLPKSKELMSLVRLYLSDFRPENKKLYESVDQAIDSTIMNAFLPEHNRTIVFENRSAITVFYPANLRPFFFYLNTGVEIGRVEIPAWIASDDLLVNSIASIVLDQCAKGGGYPVALAEAHEQAVIKGPDRDFFYHFLQKMTIERKRTVTISRKSIKKRGIGI